MNSMRMPFPLASSRCKMHVYFYDTTQYHPTSNIVTAWKHCAFPISWEAGSHWMRLAKAKGHSWEL